IGHLSGGAQRPRDRTVAVDCENQRRDCAAAVYCAEQSVLERESQRSDGQPARRHLSVRTQPVQELAAARLVRGAADHACDPRSEHRSAVCRLGLRRRQTVSGNGSVSETGAASPAKPAAVQRFEVRHLDFYYGRTQALKDINLTLADRSITAFIG